MDLDKRNKIIIAIVVAVVVTVTVVILLQRGGGNPLCALGETASVYNSTIGPKSLTSADERTLVHIFGNLKRMENSTKAMYLPLEVNSVKVKNASEPDFSLEGPCVHLTVNVTQNEADKSIAVSSIEICRTSVSGENEDCTIETPDIKYSAGNYYSCQKAKEYDCNTKDKDGKVKTVATLVLDHFEFQVLGDKASIEKGKFSGKSEVCK